MKAKIFCLFFLIVLEFIVCPQNGWTQDNTIPMIGAYYFDGWSGKNNSQELWAQEAPTHLTEKLYNDYNERQPIWGWRNDDLAIMERQIDIASQNGITFFLFCWYWKKDKGEMDIKSIENHASHTSLKLFMKARNKHKMKFALLIANHQGARIEGEDNWLKAMDYMAEIYFQDSQYLKVENKPVVAFFNAKAAAPSLTKMNDYLKAKNYAGLFSISCNDKSKGIKEQIDTITNSYNKWLYLFLNILFATCYHNNVYISFHFHMGMDHFFRVSYLLQRLLPLSYLVQNQLFE
jgi:hypothetical protein